MKSLWTAPLGSNPLIRSVRCVALEVQMVEQLVEIAQDTASSVVVNPRATAGGDERRLRGIPALAKGVASTVPGTDPLKHVIALERQQQTEAPVQRGIRNNPVLRRLIALELKRRAA